MDNEEDVHHQHKDTEQVGEVGSTLSLTEELDHAVGPQQTVESNNDPAWAHPWNEVQEIKRNERQQVQFEVHGLDIAEGHLLWFCHQKSLFQMTCGGQGKHMSRVCPTEGC